MVQYGEGKEGVETYVSSGKGGLEPTSGSRRREPGHVQARSWGLWPVSPASFAGR